MGIHQYQSVLDVVRYEIIDRLITRFELVYVQKQFIQIHTGP